MSLAAGDTASVLAAARAAVTTPGGSDPSRLRVIARRDSALPVAFLVTLERSGPALVVPLRAGRNYVGRSAEFTEHVWPARDPCAVVEGAQWFVRCDAGTARVADAASTNGAWVVPCGVALPDGVVGTGLLCAAATLAGARELVHPARAGQRLAWDDLAQGDVLVCVYSAFAFGWCYAAT